MGKTEGPVWIGFDLGGTKMLAVVYDQNLNPLGRKRRRTKGNEGSESGVERIKTTIERALEEAEVDASQLAGIGIGCPGPVDPVAGKLYTAVNLGWDDVAIGPQLQTAFNCPTWVLNDVDAGVYGEYRLGSARGARCAVGLFPGTGIGGGCVYEDQILRGTNITAMEIGHTRITSSARSSGYELPGTLEAEASRLTIAAEAAKAAFRGDAPHLLKEAGTDIGEIRSSALADAIEAGDTAVRDIVVDAMETVGFAVVNLVHLLAPDKIILGGGVVEAMKSLVLKTVRDTARKHVLEVYRDTFEVVVAELGDDAATIGAAAWAQKEASKQTPTT